MISYALVISNFTSPAVLCFMIGVCAALLKSDLRVPQQVHEAISMYLLLAIGFKGGIALSQVTIGQIAFPILATIILSILTPTIAYAIARLLGRLDVTNSAAMAAHFGSVSAVTFMAALNFANHAQLLYEPFLSALLVLLEIPGIVLALMFARLFQSEGDKRVSLRVVLHEALTGKSIVLMMAGVIVGLVGDRNSIPVIKSVFIDPFQGILVFFLLEMGVVAASRLQDIKNAKIFVLMFGTMVPLLFGMLGAFLGTLAGLSEGGAAILATMSASASYIAAPAAVRMALPNANAGMYLTTSVAITLPFNIIIGIPFYFAITPIIRKFFL